MFSFILCCCWFHFSIVTLLILYLLFLVYYSIYVVFTYFKKWPIVKVLLFFVPARKRVGDYTHTHTHSHTHAHAHTHTENIQHIPIFRGHHSGTSSPCWFSTYLRWMPFLMQPAWCRIWTQGPLYTNPVLYLWDTKAHRLLEYFI